MQEIHYCAMPELRRPGRFLAAALGDLRRSPAISYALFRNNLRARYRRSWLGYLWLCLPMVATTVVCLYLRSRSIFTLPAVTMPYPVFVLAGVTLWQLFVEALNAPLQHLAANRQLITRSRVPHEALFLAGFMEVLLNCAVRLAILLPILLWFDSRMSATLLLVPLGVLAIALLGFALGLLAAPAGTLYDDVGRAIALLTSFWFFLTPVIYHAPAGSLLQLNPVTPLLDTTRAWLVAGSMTPSFLAVSLIACGLVVLAWLIYRLARPHLAGRLG
jgi:lipopolysaccharide transport system permease protein